MEKGTVADQELRPSLEEIIKILEEIESEEIPTFTIHRGPANVANPSDDSTGFSVIINGKSYSLRRERPKLYKLKMVSNYALPLKIN